jgi:hypothetical protein
VPPAEVLPGERQSDAQVENMGQNPDMTLMEKKQALDNDGEWFSEDSN